MPKTKLTTSSQNPSHAFFKNRQTLIAFHTLEQGSLSAFLDIALRFEQYLLLSTLAHKESFFVWNLQLSLARKAKFFPLANWRPKPPSSFDLVTLCHPT